MERFISFLKREDRKVVRVLVSSIIASAAVAVLTSCSADGGGTDRVPEYRAAGDTVVTLSFNQMTMESMDARARSLTRGSLTESSMARLDVWISDGTTAQEFHQVNTDEGFGTVTATLNKTKTYTLYAIAHKATGACTLTDGIIAFPEDKLKESVWYTTTFSPSTATSLNCAMQRITGKFTLATTDVVPEEVDHFRITIAQTGTRFAVTGAPTEVADRIVDFATISRDDSGKSRFSANILAASDAATNFDITATAYDEDNNVIQTRTFADVPIRNGYVTKYAGTFFIDSGMTMSFTASDWQEYDETAY